MHERSANRRGFTIQKYNPCFWVLLAWDEYTVELVGNGSKQQKTTENRRKQMTMAGNSRGQRRMTEDGGGHITKVCFDKSFYYVPNIDTCHIADYRGHDQVVVNHC